VARAKAVAPAGYSGTPLPKKLGIEPGSVVALLGAPCALWLCWPKKASGVPTHLDENRIRDQGLTAGLVDYKVAAVDATWSGLCFARRRAR